MLKIGRYTAALILIVVGGSLLLDKSMNTQFMVKLLDWWPVILITLGIEYLLFNFWNRNGERKMKLDIGGLLIAILISAIVIGVTHGKLISSKWVDSINISFNPFSLSDESGIKFEKETLRIPLDKETEKVELENLNGNVVIRSGDVEQLEIKTTIYVSKLDKEEAKDIADLSIIEYTTGNALQIKAKGGEFKILGLKYKPKMNLNITMPENREVDLIMDLTNGNVDVGGILLKNELKISTHNGKIIVSDIEGKIIAESLNGSVMAEDITGDIQLETANGKISAKDVEGNAELETISGSVDVDHIEGNVTANSTAGTIEITQVTGEIYSNTTAGSIEVSSDVVGGDWELETTAGSIKIFVPEDGDFEIDGSTTLGSISSDFPMTESKKSIQGVVGTGEHNIEMETTAGSIELNKLN